MYTLVSSVDLAAEDSHGVNRAIWCSLIYYVWDAIEIQVTVGNNYSCLAVELYLHLLYLYIGSISLSFLVSYSKTDAGNLRLILLCRLRVIRGFDRSYTWEYLVE